MQTITLNNGVEIPLIGFGTFQITDPEECATAVSEAIKAGYRLIDTAQMYGNEAAVGEGIRRSGVARDELFVTTKLDFKRYDEAAGTFAESLEKLGLDYLDMVLLHWPFGNTYAAWRSLEKLYDEKLIRAIGVSNFEGNQLVDLLSYNKIIPAVNQIETNLLAQQPALAAVMKRYGVAHQAYAPFAQGRANEMFEAPALVEIAEKYGKTPRQVALKLFVQQGIAVIPKSVHVARMQQNLDLFDFELTTNEIKLLQELNTDKPMIGRSQSVEKVEAALRW